MTKHNSINTLVVADLVGKLLNKLEYITHEDTVSNEDKTWLIEWVQDLREFNNDFREFRRELAKLIGDIK